MSRVRELARGAALALSLGGAASAQLAFVDVAPAKGVVGLSFGRGAAMVDLDLDGRQDLISFDDASPSRFYRQRSDGTFLDATSAWGIPGDARNTWGGLVADFDNDGDPDVYEFNGGYYQPGAPNQLFRNDLSMTGTFADVSATAGDVNRIEQNFGATAVDHDRDGLLDVFQSTTDAGSPCSLLENQGGLSFLDVAPSAGIVETGPFRHCGSGDIDNDGWVELGTGNAGLEPLLYHNRCDGTYVEIGRAAGLSTLTRNFGIVFVDVDNDGWMDVFVPKYQWDQVTTTSKVFLNQGDLTFRDVSLAMGLSGQEDMGHDAGDLDADGYPELYMGTGQPALASLDFLYSVVPGGIAGVQATDVTLTAGLTTSGVTRMHGMAMGDVDRDGDIDVYCNNGGPSQLVATKQGNFLWQNQGNGNRWAVLELTGVLSNRTAVGAKSVAFTSGQRRVSRYLSVGRGFGNTPAYEQHFGIGSDVAIDHVEIRWPSGVEQIVLAPPLLTRTPVRESGMRIVGTPALGATVSLELCGPPNEVVDLFSAGATTWQLASGFGGYLELAGPIAALGTLPLDASGVLRLPLTVPNLPALSGTTLWLQGWIHPPGASQGGVLSRALRISIP